MPDGKRKRATAAEMRVRIAMVEEWIVDDDPAFAEMIRRITTEFGVGRRQAIRYLVKAREPLMTDRERYRYRYC